MIRITIAGVLLILVGACAQSEEGAPVSQDPSRASVVDSPDPLRERRRSYGRSVEGRPLEARIFGDGGECVLIIATIHGNEAAGTPLVEALCDELRQHPELAHGRRVVIVPVANPDGRAKGQRFNAHGVDLNRNFEAKNFQASRRHGSAGLSEPESRALEALVMEVAPLRVVSIHQPLSCIDWDGPGEDLARGMAAVCDLPARRLGSRPGSFGSWVGITLGIPIITLELPRSADRLDRRGLWKRYGAMMLRALAP